MRSPQVPKHWTLAQRLAFRTAPPDENGCELWTARRTPQGYGRMLWKGRNQLVSRLTWEETNGPIPDGLCVLHTCDNPPCRTLSHLFLGTRTTNNADRQAKGRTLTGRGTRHWSNKLTEDQVRAIRADTRLLREIAADYGVTFSLISAIRRRAKWAHLPD